MKFKTQHINRLFISLLLRESFLIKGRLHTGFYDGNYRKLAKKSLLDISKRTSFYNELDSSFEIIDFPECCQLRIIISVPDGWSVDRFINIVIKELEKNPSVEMILENFASTSAELERKFFSSHWKGFSVAADKG